MVTLRFTQNIQRHVACKERDLEGTTVRQVLESYFEGNETARSYVLDDQGALRHHMMVFVDGTPVSDRAALSDVVGENSELYVIQALSGG